MRCEELHDIAAEVALGTADGEERAAALRHIEGCPDCRREVEGLSRVADEILTLSPEREPPVGFEARVLERLAQRPAPRRRWGRALVRVGPPVLAAASAAAIAVVAMVAAYSDERELSGQYLAALEVADGDYFGARTLLDASGAEAGFVFAYQGSPSWLLAVVDPAHRDRVSRAVLATRSGRTIPLRGFRLDPARGSWGGAIPIDLGEVTHLRLLGERPRDALVTDESWAK